jgi:hypothetical protein
MPTHFLGHSPFHRRDHTVKLRPTITVPLCPKKCQRSRLQPRSEGALGGLDTCGRARSTRGRRQSLMSSDRPSPLDSAEQALSNSLQLLRLDRPKAREGGTEGAIDVPSTCHRRAIDVPSTCQDIDPRVLLRTSEPAPPRSQRITSNLPRGSRRHLRLNAVSFLSLRAYYSP